MRPSKILLNAAVLVFVIFLMMAGIAMMMLPWAPEMRATLADIFKNQSPIILYWGCGFFAFGILVLIILLFFNRRYYLHVIMGETPVAIESASIEAYLSEYWKKTLPNNNVHCDVAINDNNIAITVNFTKNVDEDSESFLEDTQRDLQLLLAKNFLYNKPFSIYFGLPAGWR